MAHTENEQNLPENTVYHAVPIRHALYDELRLDALHLGRGYLRKLDKKVII